MRRRIVILQRWLPHYRVPFFKRLVELGIEADYHIQLLHGEPTGADRSKEHWLGETEFPWARRVEQRQVGLGGRELLWHRGIASFLAEAGLVILPQENRIARSHIFAIMPRRRRPKLAWWGHGMNLQARRRSIADLASHGVRRTLLSRADWFFAYTALSARAVESQGFPANRITTLNNTIDVVALLTARANVSDAEVRMWRRRWNIHENAPIGVFVGGLYPAKRLDLLLAAGELIRNRLPTFTLAVAGSGVEESLIRKAETKCDWLKFVGPVFGRDKAILLAASSVWLNPGLVGLAVVDALAVGIPMITTTYPYHSPEIVYLRHDENGVITAETAHAFAAGVLRVLESDSLRQKLADAGRRDARDLTIDRMARNFLTGAVSALA